MYSFVTSNLSEHNLLCSEPAKPNGSLPLVLEQAGLLAGQDRGMHVSIRYALALTYCVISSAV